MLCLNSCISKFFCRSHVIRILTKRQPIFIHCKALPEKKRKNNTSCRRAAATICPRTSPPTGVPKRLAPPSRPRPRTVLLRPIAIGWSICIVDCGLSVCLFVCPVHDPKSRMEGHIKLKIIQEGSMGGPWHNLEVERSKTKVIRS